MRLDRLLSIVIILLNQDRTTARELAEKFEVSIRTIYRDIDSINSAGIPIVSYSGNNGGIGIMENYTIDRHILKLDDMFTILSALKGLNTTFQDWQLDSVIEKIQNLVPKDKNDQMKLYFDQIVVDLHPWGFRKGDKDNLQIIQSAIFENTLLKFFYRNAKGEAKDRIIEPMTLIFKGYAWYLFGFCRLKGGFRLFRLSRMKTVELLSENFPRRKESYKTHFSQVDHENNCMEVILSFSQKSRTRVEDTFHENQIKVLNSGDLVVKASVPDDDWLYSMIFSFGENVEVIKPSHLRKKMAEKIKKLTQIYKPDILLSNK